MHIENSHNGFVDAEATLPASLSASFSPSPPPSPDRYILTHIGQQQLIFPSQWVAEILLVERSQILVLPFYNPMLLGVIHHHGQIMPLVAIGQMLGEVVAPRRETLSVVQLSQSAGRLSGVGIVVDRASDNRSRQQFPNTLFAPIPTDGVSEEEISGEEISGEEIPDHSADLQQAIQLFHPGLLPDQLWQPQRWQAFEKL